MSMLQNMIYRVNEFPKQITKKFFVLNSQILKCIRKSQEYIRKGPTIVGMLSLTDKEL